MRGVDTRRNALRTYAVAGQDRIKQSEEEAKEYAEFYAQYWKSHRLPPPAVYNQHLNAAVTDVLDGIKERDELKKELEEEKKNRDVVAELRVKLLEALG